LDATRANIKTVQKNNNNGAECFVGMVGGNTVMAMTEKSPRGDPVIKFEPGSPKVQALRQLMSVAYEEFHQAHLAYEHALSLAGDPPNPADITALQVAGRDYARAVAKHSQVVMAWLAMVATSR
jgi:hypothetical protein